MMNEIALRLRRQLEDDLNAVAAAMPGPLERMTKSLKLVREALGKLRGHFLGSGLKGEAEIPVFKFLKPGLYQWLIYHAELFHLEQLMLGADAEKALAGLEVELLYIERFFKQYAFLYQYFLLDAGELDALYFVRGAQLQSVLLPNVPELDPEFSTSCDYLFSKFLAYQQLRTWITERLAVLKRRPVEPQSILHLLPAEDIHWTGETIDLAEVGLGLYHSGKLNHGKAGLGEIFRFLETVFKVSIGAPAKRMQELKRRKRLSRTRFLSELRENLERKMDSEDEYVPTGRKRENSGE